LIRIGQSHQKMLPFANLIMSAARIHHSRERVPQPHRETAVSRMLGHISKSPFVAASVLAAAAFGFGLVFLRPGYWMNDDLKIIWNVAGYPGGTQPVPFMIYSNVILGFALAPLYALPTALNWEILFLAVINLCSIWALLYCLLSSPVSGTYKLIGSAVILAGEASQTLNVTYTVTAVLACLSGICLILSATRAAATRWKLKTFSGIALVVLGALIRIQMLMLVLAIFLPGILFVLRAFTARRLLAAAGLTTLLVVTSYAFDRLYVASSPEWNTYYAYNAVRQQLHDAHRLSNMHNQIRRVGWTPNDQELFARWFFPDISTYSVDNLQYLVDQTSGVSQDARSTLLGFISTLTVGGLLPCYIFILGISLWMLSTPRPGRTVAAMACVWAAALAMNLLLAWAYKDPDYVLFSTIASGVTFGLLVTCFGSTTGSASGKPARGLAGRRSALRVGAILLVSAGVVLSLAQAIETSTINTARQAAFEAITADLRGLQAAGAIAPKALIVSPAHGLPYEWSYPFTLARPSVSYLDTGWITFSPTYEEVLHQFGVVSLPDALYQANNVYLMTRSSFTVFLGRYYEEHEGINVQFLPVYAMPNSPQLPGFDGIYVYKLVTSPRP
jgi:hypothetical protein